MLHIWHCFLVLCCTVLYCVARLQVLSIVLLLYKVKVVEKDEEEDDEDGENLIHSTHKERPGKRM